MEEKMKNVQYIHPMEHNTTKNDLQLHTACKLHEPNTEEKKLATEVTRVAASIYIKSRSGQNLLHAVRGQSTGYWGDQMSLYLGLRGFLETLDVQH